MMQIKVINGRLSLASLYKPIAIGFGLGAGAIFLPMFLLLALLSLLFPSHFALGGKSLILAMVIMLPFVVGLQSLLIGGAVILGLAIYRIWGTLRVASLSETTHIDLGKTNPQAP